MLPRIAIVMFVCAVLPACRSTVQPFDPFATGRTRIAPPPTGSIGQPADPYYRPGQVVAPQSQVTPLGQVNSQAPSLTSLPSRQSGDSLVSSSTVNPDPAGVQTAAELKLNENLNWGSNESNVTPSVPITNHGVSTLPIPSSGLSRQSSSSSGQQSGRFFSANHASAVTPAVSARSVHGPATSYIAPAYAMEYAAPLASQAGGTRGRPRAIVPGLAPSATQQKNRWRGRF